MTEDERMAMILYLVRQLPPEVKKAFADFARDHSGEKEEVLTWLANK